MCINYDLRFTIDNDNTTKGISVKAHLHTQREVKSGTMKCTVEYSGGLMISGQCT